MTLTLIFPTNSQRASPPPKRVRVASQRSNTPGRRWRTISHLNGFRNLGGKLPTSRSRPAFRRRNRCGDRRHAEGPARSPASAGFMSRIVLDTNIIVSALLQPVGPPAQIFCARPWRPASNCALAPISMRNMKRSSAARGSNDLKKNHSQRPSRDSRGGVLGPSSHALARNGADPDDNMFTIRAQAAGAEYLVTGNLKHFPPTWEGTRIATPRHLLDVVLGKSSKDRV